VGYVTLDGDGLILEANLTSAEILGRKKENLIGQRLSLFVVPEDQDTYHFYQQQLSKTDTLLRTEVSLLKADGSQFHARLHGRRVVQAGEARVLQYRIVIGDITERVEAEQARQEAHNFVSAVLDTAGALIIVLDRQGGIVRFNRACEQLSGYSFAEVQGQPVWDLLLPEERAPVRAVFEQLRAGRFPNKFENYWVARDGSRHLISWSNTALPDPEGVVQYVIGTGLDITQRKEAEEAYRMLVDYSLQGMAIFEGVDQRFRLVFANPGLSRIGSYSTSELMSMTPNQLKMLIHPEDRNWVWERARDYLVGKPVSPRFEFRFICKVGLVRWVEGYANRIEYHGKPAIQVAFIDITERKQAEEVQAYLAAIVDSYDDAVIGKTLEGTVVSWNRGAEHLYGYRAEEMIGCSITQIFPPERYDELPYLLARVRQGEAIKNYETQRITKDGRRLIIALTLSPIKDVVGKLVGASVIARDITLRKQTELELAQLLEAVSEQREQLRTVTRQLAEAQEVERKALARELHDQVGQKLTALNLNLNTLRTRLGGALTTTEPVSVVLEQSLKLVEETTERVQNLMVDLRPPMLDNYGLLAALQWYGAEVAAQANFEVVVQGEEPEPRLAAPVEHTLFRITQEALTNVVKHAQATQVTITLAEDNGTVRLIIADDGQGFGPSRPKPGERPGWGLLTMAERAEAVGGQCQIKSRPGQGTQVLVEVRR
jgi:PAS domain S-box-containing protein